MAGKTDNGEIAVDALSEEAAAQELARLAQRLATANDEYYLRDAPTLSDAEYDRLKRRNAAIEARFPKLKRLDSPSEQIGAAPSDGFDKVQHRVRMLSLSNAFEDDDITEFDTRIRRYLGLGADEHLNYTAEPKIDGLSLSLRYENGQRWRPPPAGMARRARMSLPMPGPSTTSRKSLRARPTCWRCAARSI